ncbi:BTB/POZ domain and ankyrin repeat-containing protein NPR1 isoform X1 [Aegilops tauschii subsp. strangulata]|nr:BTB/POZ domain and ankyrin repeat-containing protein NPR1 isoform X1 [Aegilops tauschii subsp. strangulata]
MGVQQSGEIIVVKRLMPSMVGAQSLFENEVHHLMRLRHPNIVRLMGYCYETKKVILEYRGKNVFAERSEMLLCLEYLPKGSLDGYISDGSSQLDWHTCYKIIEGICNGLHYLHEQIDKSVLHLDLKPANVLLDNNLAPKLTDFGLSRLLDQYQTMFTPNRFGTLGYMAPEYIDEGTITPKTDIFSLGVIIMELITGHRDYPSVAGTSSEGFIEHVLKKWRNTLEKAQGYTKLEIDCQQIKRCIQIGLICVNPEWSKRPTTAKIIKMLKGLESSDCRISNEATSSAHQTSNGVSERGKQPPKNTLCIEILEQAERQDLALVSLAIAGDCLCGKLKLLYLKNGEHISPQASIVRIVVPGSPAGTKLHVDPYMLSMRSPYLRAIFTRHNNQYGASEGSAEGNRMDLQEFLGKEVKVEYDALLLVLLYLYSGRVGDLPESAYICADENGCAHLGCHPTVSFKVQVLFVAFTFQVPELTSLFQRDLLDVLHKVEVDNLPLILSVANLCKKSCGKLLERCLEMVVQSNLDMITLEKVLPPDVVKQITDLRLSFGLASSEDMGFPNKHVRRILRALDSDDVELVRILIKEGQTNLDDAFALHYAVEHCDSKITTELLDIALADVSLRNPRGYTVLHIAARRKDPKIIVSLLTKGARPSDFTFDGRKAVHISKRLTKHGDYFANTGEGKPYPNDKLCIEILEQAERRDSHFGKAYVSLALDGDVLRGRLLYLENRVALSRILFPVEARVATDIAQVDGTSEFALGHLVAIDLNGTPTKMKDEHLARMRALSKTVKLGKRYFPRCSNVLDKIMDDEPELASLGRDASSERKRRFHDLQDTLLKAFSEDKEEFNRTTTLSSSSSSTPTVARNLTGRPRR